MAEPTDQPAEGATAPGAATTEPRGGSTKHGAGRALVVVYAVLAIGSTSRALFELATKFSQAPLPYTLSAVAAVVYCVITWALVRDTASSRRIATIAMIAELVGVLVVGTWSVLDGAAFPKSSVWFWFGRDYLFVPLLLPVWGLAFLWRTRRSDASGD